MTATIPRIEQAPAEHADKLFLESTLLRVSGALFSHDAKRAASRTGKIEVNKAVKEKRIVISLHPDFGQPGPLAHKVFIALMKKHSDYGRPVQNTVAFGKRELMRLVGREEWGGSASEQLTRALYSIRRTSVTAFFKTTKGRFIEDDFNIFDRIILERASEQSNVVEACSVTIAEPIIVSLKDDHFTCLNHFLMARLGTIGQALYMRVFFHLANTYESQSTRHGLSLEKHYGDICGEWLGGLKVLDRKSKILGEQLGTHLDQLKHAGFLASYGLAKAKSRDGFVLTFRPGPLFFEDYNRFYRHKNQGELQWNFHGDRRDQIEPMQVAALFMAKRHGTPAETIANVVTSDVETARELIQLLGYDKLPSFIDYALAQAKTTRFEVERLAGLKQYVERFHAHAQGQVAAAARSKAQRATALQEAEQEAYENWCGQEIKRRIAALSPEVVSRIEAKIRAEETESTMPTLVSMAVHVALRRHVAELEPLPDFTNWKQRRHATA